MRYASGAGSAPVICSKVAPALASTSSLPAAWSMSRRVISISASEVGIVRLVAVVALHAVRVLRGYNLRETRRFGCVLLMTRRTERGDIGKLRLHRRRIVGVLRQRTVARLASHVRVLAFSPRLALVLMAEQALIL